MKTNFLKIFSSLVIFSLAFCFTASFAGIMADFTDSDAKKLNAEQMKEQNESYVNPVGKSSDNFLESLSVEGFALSPAFNKQTINYEIKEEVSSNEIIINAKAENEKAKVTGTGTIELGKGENNIKIDVTAENGVMRSYFINVKTADSSEANNTAENNTLAEENLSSEEIEETNISSINETNANSTLISPKTDEGKVPLVIAILMIAIIIIALILIKSDKKDKKKHHSKH